MVGAVEAEDAQAEIALLPGRRVLAGEEPLLTLDQRYLGPGEPVDVAREGLVEEGIEPVDRLGRAGNRADETGAPG